MISQSKPTSASNTDEWEFPPSDSLRDVAFRCDQDRFYPSSSAQTKRITRISIAAGCVCEFIIVIIKILRMPRGTTASIKYRKMTLLYHSKINTAKVIVCCVEGNCSQIQSVFSAAPRGVAFKIIHVQSTCSFLFHLIEMSQSV